MKSTFRKIIVDFQSNALYIVTWTVMAVVLGIICGGVGAAFHHAVDFATEFRLETPVVSYLFPIGGILIVFLYNFVGLEDQPGTNTIINSVRQQENIPMLLAPAIFIATVITHLVGGSSGREGAALQIGGSIATSIGKLVKANENQMSILIMCGMTAVFSALFGTPVTATIFSMEVISVGVFYYSALVPCLCCGLTAYSVAKMLGCSAVRYTLEGAITINVFSALKLALFATIIAIVSILFVLLMHKTHHFFDHHFKNMYIRVIVGSILLIIMILVFGRDYLGAGMNICEKALFESVHWYDFILKAIFTAITIGCGFKGGEIVPTFFIGSTLGYLLGLLLGLDPHLCASLGMVGLFGCVVNAPIASMVLAIEIFGINNFIPFMIVIAIGFVMSDYYSLYQSQKFIYSKTNTKFINQKAQ